MEYRHTELLSNTIEAIRDRRPENVYFVACGGSLAYMYNQQYIFDLEMTVPTAIVNSGEFIHRDPKGLGSNSLVVLCSHSGDTPETAEAAAFARKKGALTVAYSHRPGSPLWNAVDFGLHYDWGEGVDAYEHRSGMALRFVFGLLNALQPAKRYERALETMKGLDALFSANKDLFKERADRFGAGHKRDSIIYTMGSGPIFGDVYSFAVCLLQEMQWIHSAPIHSGEFFHGPFEITDYDVPFLLMKTIGRMRPLDERAHRFLERYSDRVTVVDAEDFDWSGVDDEMKQYFAAPIFGAVLRTYAEQLAHYRGHPLAVRRYMWRFEY